MGSEEKQLGHESPPLKIIRKYSRAECYVDIFAGLACLSLGIYFYRDSFNRSYQNDMSAIQNIFLMGDFPSNLFFLGFLFLLFLGTILVGFRLNTTRKCARGIVLFEDRIESVDVGFFSHTKKIAFLKEICLLELRDFTVPRMHGGKFAGTKSIATLSFQSLSGSVLTVSFDPIFEIDEMIETINLIMKIAPNIPVDISKSRYVGTKSQIS